MIIWWSFALCYFDWAYKKIHAKTKIRRSHQFQSKWRKKLKHINSDVKHDHFIHIKSHTMNVVKKSFIFTPQFTINFLSSLNIFFFWNAIHCEAFIATVYYRVQCQFDFLDNVRLLDFIMIFTGVDSEKCVRSNQTKNFVLFFVSFQVFTITIRM